MMTNKVSDKAGVNSRVSRLQNGSSNGSIRGPGGTTIHHIVQASSPRLSISEPGGLAGNCGGAQHAGMQAALRGHRQALR